MYIKNIAYNEFDQRVRVDYGNDATSTYDYYEKTQRLKNLTTTLNGQTLQNINYHYTDAGDIESRDNNFVEADGVPRTSYQDYQYDTTNQLHRLVGSTGSYKVNSQEINNYQDTFTYDTIGNFVSKVQTNNEDKGTGLLPKGDTTYTYNYQYDHSRPHAVISTGEKAYQYDLNGNMTGWVAAANASLLMNITWDDENRLTKTQDLAKTTQYKYDDKGKRIIKNGGTSEIVYVNDNYSIRNDDVTCKHIFAENTRVATKMSFPDATGGTYFYHGDHLGSSSVVTSDSKAFYEHLEYFPYGETWVQDRASSNQTSMPYKFTGQIQDDETGLYYFGTRYYEPKLSRWVSADKAFEKFLPVANKNNKSLPGMGGVYNHMNLNMYNYAGNNPIVFYDPDGNQIVPFGNGFHYGSSQDQEENHALIGSTKRNMEIMEIIIGEVTFMGPISRLLFKKSPYTNEPISDAAWRSEMVVTVFSFGFSEYANIFRATYELTMASKTTLNFLDFIWKTAPPAYSIAENIGESNMQDPIGSIYREIYKRNNWSIETRGNSLSGSMSDFGSNGGLESENANTEWFNDYLGGDNDVYQMGYDYNNGQWVWR